MTQYITLCGLSLTLTALILTGCTASKENIRSLVREEIVQQSRAEFFTSEKVIGPYSPAVRAGNFLFLSGQIGLDPATMTLAGDDIESQTRQVFANITSLLATRNAGPGNIIQSTVYLKDINDFTRMNQIYGTFFPNGQYPTRTTVEVSALPKGARIEIAVVAYVP